MKDAFENSRGKSDENEFENMVSEELDKIIEGLLPENTGVKYIKKSRNIHKGEKI